MNSLRDVACARHCRASSVLRYGARLALTRCGQGCWRSLSYPALGAPAPHPGYGESWFEERRRVASNGERHGQEGLGEIGPKKLPDDIGDCPTLPQEMLDWLASMRAKKSDRVWGGAPSNLNEAAPIPPGASRGQDDQVLQ